MFDSVESMPGVPPFMVKNVLGFNPHSVSTTQLIGVTQWHKFEQVLVKSIVKTTNLNF